jgi:hypothetical protein
VAATVRHTHNLHLHGLVLEEGPHGEKDLLHYVVLLDHRLGLRQVCVELKPRGLNARVLGEDPRRSSRHEHHILLIHAGGGVAPRRDGSEDREAPGDQTSVARLAPQEVADDPHADIEGRLGVDKQDT